MPNGRWVCDDDGSAHGRNAALQADGGFGVYDVYVGTFGGASATTTLMASEVEIDFGGQAK